MQLTAAISSGDPQSEPITKIIPLHLSTDDERLVSRLKRKAKTKKPLRNEEKKAIIALYSRFHERSTELREILEAGKVNGQEDKIKKQLSSVESIKTRLALLAYKSVPVSLKEDERQLIQSLERTKNSTSAGLGRQAEYLLFEIYSRFSERAHMLRCVLAQQLTKREKAAVEQELAFVEGVKQRIFNLGVLTNQRLATSIASRFPGDFKDNLQEGNLGLMKGLEKYDYRRGYRLSTYLSWWIRHTIQRAIADKSRTIRIPVHIQETLKKIRKFMHTYAKAHGKNPDAKEISQGTKIPIKKVIKALGVPEVCPLDERFVSHSNQTEIQDVLAPKQLAEHLHKLLADLKPRERDVLEKRFGLDGNGGMKLREVSEDMGLTRGGVSNLQTRALKKLRTLAEEKNLQEYL
jgi:RNA polymerase sigma factor (sigma-70 family)